jgi:cytochrome c biogenesis protein CcmG, thiol:disulfide interchange protein DsbE
MCMPVEEQPAGKTSPGDISGELFAGKRKVRMQKRRIVIFVVAILLSAGLLALMGSQLLTPAQNQSEAASSPLVGHPAPDFTLAVLGPHASSAPAIHLASLKGKPIMLNFWASWCIPCQQEAPLLQQTWQSVQRQGVIFLGIDFQDARSDGLNFLHTYGVTYLNVADDTGATAINYGLTGVPETFFLDRHGVIVSKVTGELTEQSLQKNLQLIAH